VPRRSLFTPTERALLLAFPTDEAELIQNYTFSEHDLSVILQHRGEHNRLGFAVQLCYLRYPGYALPVNDTPPERMLQFVAQQVKVNPVLWPQYAERAETRREHLIGLQAAFGFKPFSEAYYRNQVQRLSNIAMQTDKGIIVATELVHDLRKKQIIVPAFNVIERLCKEAITQGTRRIHHILAGTLTKDQCMQLDGLLDMRPEAKTSIMAWLRQPPGSPKAKHVLEHIERLKAISSLNLPEGLERQIHQNRLLKLAREGGQMTAQHLQDFEPGRRHATLAAVVLEARATLIDEIVDMNDRIIGTLFNRAKRKHAEEFQQSGKVINEKVRLYWQIGEALLEAKKNGRDPFAAIESIIPWEDFTKSIIEAQKLAQAENFDYLNRIGNGYSQIRRYAPSFLESLQLTATPATHDIMDAIEMLKSMNADNVRKVPDTAPTGFIRKRWESLVFTDTGIDRRFYELCTLTELKNALRSGDIWIKGSRQFKDFDEYLLPNEKYGFLRDQGELPLAVALDCDQYLEERLALMERELETVNYMAGKNELPDAMIRADGLKITPLTNAVPEKAETLMRQAYALLPHLKITELLLEVDNWTDFTRHFTHLKSGDTATDQLLLLTAILADAINLGLAKMAESCPGTTYAKLSWFQAWHIRDETYSAALADLVNAQYRQSFASYWGDGTTSSSDGQRFRAGGHGAGSGQVNAKYGNEPGVLFYTHISDQYAPFHTQVINATVRDATYVLDGLLHHESDLRIEEHYTDTAGFTDHVFALMRLLGFRFAPRIRDLADKRLFVPSKQKTYPALSGLIGGTVNQKQIRTHWEDILRLATSIKQGTVTASLMLRKLGSYPRQNGLALALRELGRIERTLFSLEWMQSVELRRRVQIGLNKGEAKNALARAVFFNRLGEIRDRSFENQRYRASGLNIVVAAIILWNTVYLERTVNALKFHGHEVDESLLQNLSPLGWEHINLTGDYIWENPRKAERRKFRQLQPLPKS
jgi:TnpA family transposase